ncbi:hypothetical protein OG215_40110 (plasmid) [Streptomyces globisporus]|uniref:hypothetical protein n=1 Tax=Streptomyces globisporus TaxID=1908 RepID=UPI002F90D19E|nr:hypothetical protein OG215_40110 [Streptomyces globisporus]
MLTANLAADLDVWVRLLTSMTATDSPTPSRTPCASGSTTCTPGSAAMPAADGSASETTWPWASAFITAWTRINSLPVVT